MRIRHIITVLLAGLSGCAASVPVTQAGAYDYTDFPDVEITGIDPETLSEAEQEILYILAKYCQAMVDKDIDTMRSLVPEDMIFTHMSGRRQTREEYFADVQGGQLNYYRIGISDPRIAVDGDRAEVTYTSILEADAYGAHGTYRMSGTHYWQYRDRAWQAANGN